VRKLKLLLLQARLADDPMREHEHRCFVERTGLEPAAVVPHDLCQGPPTLAALRRHDALTVGGSGDFYVSKGNLPHFEAYLEFLREAIAIGHPTFSSCYGYGSIVSALGGAMVLDPERAEVGTYEVTLTEQGRSDPLFGTLPPTFMAQMGHKDRVAREPDGVANLVFSERCAQHALRIPGKPIWATQFHPELDRRTNLDRFRRYLADYGPKDPKKLAEAEAGFEESPEAAGLLRGFLGLVFG